MTLQYLLWNTSQDKQDFLSIPNYRLQKLNLYPMICASKDPLFSLLILEQEMGMESISSYS